MNHGAIYGVISINITAEAVAWYAAIIGTFSAIKVIYDILTDRRMITLSYRTDVTIQGGAYDPKVQQFCLEVINTGKRVVKIVNVGYFQKDGRKVLLTDSMYNPESRILTDSNPSTSYFTPNKNVSLDKLWYLYALDGRGKVYKKYLYKFARLQHVPVYFIRRKRKNDEDEK